MEPAPVILRAYGFRVDVADLAATVRGAGVAYEMTDACRAGNFDGIF